MTNGHPMGGASAAPTQTDVDLTNCDREAIHLLGNVQPYGCLLAVSSDWLIQHASRNISDFLGWKVEDAVGHPLSDVLPQASLGRLRAKLSSLRHEDATARIIDFDLMADGRRFDVSLHQSGRSLLIEAEL
ncbi:MAG: PAS domain-containing protein, partial [Pseudomonadota bacterium]|nr:PAS domain-containing protein [Pseudomonadota bacterium]